MSRVAAAALPDPAPPAGAVHQWSIRSQILALVLAVAIPLIVVIGYLIYERWQHGIVDAETAALELAQITAADTTRFLGESRDLLDRLAQRPGIRALDAQACEAVFTEFLLVHNAYSNLRTIDADGRIVCSAVAPAPGVASRPDTERLAQAMRLRPEFTVNPAIFSVQRGRWITQLTYPLRNDPGDVTGLVLLGADLMHFQPLVRRDSVPNLTPGTVLSILDSRGIVIARSVDAARYVGQALDLVVPGRVQSGSGTWLGADQDGETMVFGVAPVDGTDWVALAAVPGQSLVDAAHQSALAGGTVALVSLLLAGFLALRAGRRVALPLERLTALARSVEAGQPVPRLAPGGAREVAELAARFNRMLDALDQRERELTRSRERLRGITDSIDELVWSITPDGKEVLFVSRAALEIAGHHPEEFIASPSLWLTLVHEEDRERLMGALESLPERGRFDEEYRIARPDGAVRWVHDRAQLARGPDGAALRIDGVMADVTERKRAETALRQSEAYLRAIVEAEPECVKLMDAQGRLLDMNRAGLDMLGAAALDEIRGAELRTLVLDPYREAFDEMVEAVFRGESRTLTFEMRMLSGAPRWMETHAVPLRAAGPASEIRALLAVTRDISEHRRAQAATADALASLQLMMDSVPAYISFVDADERYRMVNRQYEEWFGRPRAEIAGCALVDVHSPESYREIQPHVAAALAGERVHYEVSLVDLDGRQRWLDAQYVPRVGASGKAEGFFAIIFDITTHKKVEEELRQLTAELEQRVAERTAEVTDLYNNAPCGYHSLGPDGGILMMNDTELRWLGYERSEVIGKSTLRDFLAPESVAVFEAAFPGFKQRGYVYDLEYDMLRKDGTRFPVLLSATAIYDRQGNYVMSRSTLFDITARKRAETAVLELNRRLQEQADRLEAANRELETFTYSVSHDLKAPLRGIDGYSRLLLDECAASLSGDAVTFLQNIRHATGQMSELIDDLLAYSRLERRALVREDIRLDAMLESLVRERADDIAAGHVAVSIDTGCGAVRADREGLALAVRNLLDNAIKFSAGVPDPRIEIALREADGRCLLSVRDNGPGFDMRYHDRIFEIFQRLHRAEDFPGTGVGLAIVRKAMDRMGGRAWAESAPGQGATFYLDIPR